MKPPDIFAAPPMPSDTLTIGKFIFYGVPPDDEKADVVVIKEKQLGMTFGVSNEIAALLRCSENDRTPTDRDRLNAYIERCVDEEYIVSLCRVIENDFEEDESPIHITGVWQQGYAYRRISPPAKPSISASFVKHVLRYHREQPLVEDQTAKFCRLVVLDVPKANAEDGVHVIKHVLHYYREQKLRRMPIPVFEASAGNPNSARRQRE